MKLETIRQELENSIAVKQAALKDELLLAAIMELAENCLNALKSGGKIIFCGNGGSFADSQHLSAEFTSRFMFDRASLPSLALGTNSSSMSAIANDYGYEFVFSRELESISHENDVVVAISTSGNSKNILNVVDECKARKICVWGFTGKTGGALAKKTKWIKAPSDDTARIQELHIVIGHIICGLVEAAYFKDINCNV